MIETLVTGLILAFVTGVTVVAYRHPAGFKRNFTGLISLISYPSIMVFAWGILDVVMSAGVIYGISASNPAFPLSSIASYAVKLHSALIRIGVTTVIFLGSLGYLYFLRRLPDLLADDHGKEDPDSRPNP